MRFCRISDNFQILRFIEKIIAQMVNLFKCEVHDTKTRQRNLKLRRLVSNFVNTYIRHSKSIHFLMELFVSVEKYKTF